jgi:hypothetical protein
MMESHVSERCFRAAVLREKGTTVTGRKRQVHYDHIIGMQPGNSRHYQVLVKL